MAVLLPGKLLYLAVPRTASVSTETALLAFEGAIRLEKHITYGQVKADPSIPFQGTEVVFTTIRNPYDILTTDFYYEEDRYPHFLTFVREYEHWPFVVQGKLFWLLDEVDEAWNAIGVDFEDFYQGEGPFFVVLQYENLSEELDALLRTVGLPTVNLPRKNISKDKKPWRTYYTPEAIEAVNERFGEEIKKWGYDLLDPVRKSRGDLKRYVVPVRLEIDAESPEHAQEVLEALQHVGVSITDWSEPEETRR